jgi:hypothetical protein
MSLLWGTFAVLFVIIGVITLFDLIRSRGRRSGGATALWAVLIVCLPFVGSIIYWLRRDAEDANVGVEEQRLAQEAIRREAAQRSVDSTSINPRP